MSGWRRPLAAGVVVLALMPVAAKASTRCADPAGAWERRTPAELDLDAARLQDALDWANLHAGLSMAVYRHGCLAAESRLDALTAGTPLDGWSMTKTVTALLVGRAARLGLLGIGRPIGPLYPEADPAHARLRPRHLLTMTGGLHRNWVRDLSPQEDRIKDALSLAFDHRPGTYWEYQQSPVTLLLNAVERSAGMDVQDWAQKELFGPLGIPREAWSWDRDRTGHTEGWAHLHMVNHGWARLGQLMLNRGRWRGRRLISSRYMRRMTTPTRRINGAYGYLTWLNRGGRYVLPAAAGEDRGRGKLIPAGPRDMFLMAGMGEQRTYVIPSRDLVIVRLGDRGSRELDTRVTLWTGRGGQLDHELVRRRAAGSRGRAVRRPRPLPRV